MSIESTPQKSFSTAFENSAIYKAKPAAAKTSIIMLKLPPPALMPITKSAKHTAAQNDASSTAVSARNALSLLSARNASYNTPEASPIRKQSAILTVWVSMPVFI